MQNFVIPLQPSDLEQRDDARLFVEDLVDVGVLASEDVDNMLTEVDDALDRKPYVLTNHEHFDALYSLIKGAATLSDIQKKALCKCLTTVFSNLLLSCAKLCTASSSDDQLLIALAIHKVAVKMAVFLQCFLLEILEKEAASQSTGADLTAAPVAGAKGKAKKTAAAKSSTGFEWDFWKCELLKSVLSAFERLDFVKLFHSDRCDEDMAICCVRTSSVLMENSVNMRASSEVRRLVQSVLCASVPHVRHTQAPIALLLHVLFKYEHVAEVLAESMRIIVVEHSAQVFAADVLREIGRMDPAELAQDTTGTRSMSTFISEFCERVPTAFSGPGLAALLPHLDGESYTFRNAILHCLGVLMSTTSAATQSENDDMTEKGRGDKNDAFADILLERLRDQNAYTRSKAVQTWTALCRSRCIPRNRTIEVMKTVAGRLVDKSAFVRKAAAEFLTACLEFNPFGAVLEKKLYAEKLQELLAVQNEGNAEDAGAQMIGEDVDKSTPAKSSAVRLLEFAIEYLDTLVTAVPDLIHLLGSRTASDACETVRFFRTAFAFKLQGAEAGLRRMFVLVWSREPSVRTAVVEAVHDLFFGASSVSESRALIHRMLELLDRADVAEMSSLEEVLVDLGAKDVISRNSIVALWDAVERNPLEEWPASQSGVAMAVIAMLASVRPQIVRDRMGTITGVAFGPRASQEPELVKHACLALAKTFTVGQQGQAQAGLVGADHTLVKTLVQLMAVAASAPLATQDLELPQRCIDALYALCSEASSVWSTFVQQQWQHLSGEIEAESAHDEHNARMAFFFHVLTHGLLREYMVLEELYEKRRKALIANEEQDQTEEESGKGKKKSKKDSQNAKDSEAIERELGTQAAAQLVLEQERDARLVALVAESPLIQTVLPHIVASCTHLPASNLSERRVRAAALVALCRLMALDRSLCHAHMQLLCTCMDRSLDARTRANAIIAIGDLCFRHPNTVEPWAPYMFRRLSDQDAFVRKTALMVVSHLVLNDMVKIKAHGASLAKLLEDQEPRISDLAHLFFHELSQKNNLAVYNVLPDILGVLSADESFSLQSFENVARTLIEYVDKERQTESLVDKICVRFRATRSVHTWRALSTALSCFNFGERAFKKLSEHFKSYSDALVDSTVTEALLQISAKAKKFARQEAKGVFEDWEARIDETRMRLIEEQGHLDNASKQAKEGSPDAEHAESDVADADVDPGATAEEVVDKKPAVAEVRKTAKAEPAKKKSTRAAAAKKTKKKAESEDEEDADMTDQDKDLSVEEPVVQKKKVVASRSARTASSRKKVIDSDDEDEE